MNYEQYEHHGNIVWTRPDLKGTHRDNCLCYDCAAFHPEDRALNCPVAQRLYEFDVAHKLVTPVYECPVFEKQD